MKALVVTNDFPPRVGGIETFVRSLCEGLDPAAVVVYTASMPGAAEFDRQLAFPVVRDRSATLIPTPRVGREVAATAREYGCDRVVFGAAAPLGLLARRLREHGITRIVAMTHGHEVWWSRVPAARALLRRIADDADVITYVSDYCRDEIGSELGPAARLKLRRLSPDVDLTRFQPSPNGADGSVMRARWGSGERPVVLSASRLVTRKGQDVLLEAWSAVSRAHQDAQLVIVGDGPARAALRRRQRRLKLDDSTLIWPGLPWEQMPQVYAAADVFALPCRTRRAGLEPEALGIAFLEASAAGLPIVVGDSGGAAETVVDGETGYLVSPRDPAMVADRIIALLDSKPAAQAMGLRGRSLLGEQSAGDAARVLRGLLESQ